VVELTHAGEQEKNSQTLTKAVQRLLGRPLAVFVPSLSTDVREDSQILVYMDGYVFVEFYEDIQYTRLRDTSYFNEVLCSSPAKGGPPVYSLIEDDRLNVIKKDMESIRVAEFAAGDPVKVKSGTNRGLPGIVLGVEDDVVTVQHLARSKPVIADYRTTFLENLRKRG